MNNLKNKMSGIVDLLYWPIILIIAFYYSLSLNNKIDNLFILQFFSQFIRVQSIIVCIIALIKTKRYFKEIIDDFYYEADFNLIQFKGLQFNCLFSLYLYNSVPGSSMFMDLFIFLIFISFELTYFIYNLTKHDLFKYLFLLIISILKSIIRFILNTLKIVSFVKVKLKNLFLKRYQFNNNYVSQIKKTKTIRYFIFVYGDMID
ncbi:hypothetical protein [Spiroplasma turonicum]|uniref:Transmembrane protein n=1 Tax=Spiroplasma turonicum TaxID=216946 RepID=A0A0K1P7C1_9MOLU|nr:hypothetical protein [Spiroplasma turonicum]AKU80188.1 hypothetical protein STURON_00942 [Spiroplasma turonicum]ALX71188.1 hypothetical protein STURO_v1c09370 [Spiroplasma turonicum]